MRHERIGVLLLRAFPSFYRRLRSKLYALVLDANNLKLGRNVTLSGTKNIRLGSNVLIGNQCWLDAIEQGKIIISDDVSMSQNVHIAAKLHVKLGRGCLIGSDVLITDHNHSYGSEMSHVAPKMRGLTIKGDTVIGDNCWLGDNVKILSGVHLGDNVIVAANSVVTKSFPSNCIVGGIPANLIKVP